MMKFFERCWVLVLQVFDAIISPWSGDSTLQQPLLGGPIDLPTNGRGPSFGAPNSPLEDQFICNYSAMGSHWKSCSTEFDRGCWLKDTLHGQDFDINTDYENRWPNGTLRTYTLDVSELPLNLDGVTMPYGKTFNRTYPGPWIQACWGDDVQITVTNNIRKFNGTTIHWHGVRQLNTFQHDGVNGVTQCPIPPGSSYTYSFKVTQYGSTWYHSHYSLQYADGLVGPMTFYGPSSANYDLAIEPTLMTDWNHESAFTDLSRMQFTNSGPPDMDSILLNGIGNYAGVSCGGKKYTISFVPGKRYLMRLINTSVDTTFVFAIDGHQFWVMSSDFVPIKPYKTDHVVIGIGQRYHVVVEASQFEVGHPLRDENYWIRTIPATNCSKFALGNTPDERQGILRYDSKSDVIPTTARGKFSLSCRDEPYDKLSPVFEWTVGCPANNVTNDTFDVGLTGPSHEQPLLYGLFRRWAIGSKPLWLDFSHPTILNLDTPPGKWSDDLVVIPEDFDKDSWVYLLIIGNKPGPADPTRTFVSAAHPIHLHGHDFALLQQSEKPFVNKSSLNLKLYNPPRRDVVLLPINGFVVIAFKTDNPGAWLLHCHIAWHASSGLALQILERASAIGPPTWRLGWLDQTIVGCRNWETWFADPGNLWDSNYTFFQDDSGI